MISSAFQLRKHWTANKVIDSHFCRMCTKSMGPSKTRIMIVELSLDKSPKLGLCKCKNSVMITNPIEGEDPRRGVDQELDYDHDGHENRSVSDDEH